MLTALLLALTSLMALLATTSSSKASPALLQLLVTLTDGPAGTTAIKSRPGIFSCHTLIILSLAPRTLLAMLRRCCLH
jgi:hypothetical protein